MTLRFLFFLVEGSDDRRFAEQVVVPICPAGFTHVQVWDYAQQKPERVRSFLRSVECMGSEYFFLCDLNRAPCVMDRKGRIVEPYRCIRSDRIVVVARSIEAWYAAGMDEAAAQRLRLRPPDRTDDFDKEKFDKMMEDAGFHSRTDLMAEILKGFSRQEAVERNNSLKYLRRRLEALGQG